MNVRLLFSQETRTGRFLLTLGSSYVLLGSATLYSFLTIPMILHFASQEVLGLWLLVSQITTNLTAIDAGLSSSSIRQFVGPVASSEPSRLAPRFQSTLAISVFQGLIIAAIGILGAGPIVNLWSIPSELKCEFVLLFSAQATLVGITFPLRPFSSILLAAQRFGPNYILNAVLVFLALLLGWLGFLGGIGIWGLFIGNVIVGLGQFFFAIFGVYRMNFLPALFCGWQVKGADLRIIARESLSFASGPLFATATGLLQSSVLSRLFGLEGVALWNVGAKMAMVLSQILSKLFESSFAGLSELVDDGRRDTMVFRFGQLAGGALTASGLLACLLFVVNGPFISVWTSEKILWPQWGTWWVGLLLLLATCHQAFSEAMKMLVVWAAIRKTPVLDFCFFCLAMALAYFFDTFPAFVAAAVLGPYLVGICVNGLKFRAVVGGSFGLRIPQPLRITFTWILFLYLLAGLWLLFH